MPFLVMRSYPSLNSLLKNLVTDLDVLAIDISVAKCHFSYSDVYIIYLDLSLSSTERCLVTTISQNTWLWHGRLGHASMNLVTNYLNMILLKGYLS